MLKIVMYVDAAGRQHCDSHSDMSPQHLVRNLTNRDVHAAGRQHRGSPDVVRGVPGAWGVPPLGGADAVG